MRTKVVKREFIEEFKYLLNLLEDYNEYDTIEVNSEAGRGGGRNVQFITALFVLLAKYPKYKFNVAVFRKQSKDLKELWDDFEEWKLYEWDIKHKYKEAEINGNKIVFNSLYTSAGKPVSNLGKSMKKGADYMITWTDEATEMTPDDFKKIDQGYARHGKKNLKLRSWNTWSPHYFIVKYMSEVMPYPGVEWMKKNHFQLKTQEETTQVRGEDARTIKLFMRNSAYVNPFSPKAHIMALEEIARWDEDEGNTILWAKPGVVDGAVYKNVDQVVKATEQLEVKFKKIIAGIDFGISDATTVSLLGVSSDKGYRSHGVHVIDEYYHKNEKGQVYKDMDAYVEDVINFLTEKYNEYRVMTCEIPIIYCYVDYARQTSKEIAFVDMLKQRALEKGIQYLKIEKAHKEPIRDRIVLTKYLIASKRLTLDKDKAPELIREMTDAHYDTSRITTDGFHPRSDGNDHVINAFEYALSSIKDELHRYVG